MPCGPRPIALMPSSSSCFHLRRHARSHCGFQADASVLSWKEVLRSRQMLRRRRQPRSGGHAFKSIACHNIKDELSRPLHIRHPALKPSPFQEVCIRRLPCRHRSHTGRCSGRYPRIRSVFLFRRSLPVLYSSKVSTLLWRSGASTGRT